MNEQENTKSAARMYETFMSGDVKEFLNLFSDDVSWETPKIENVPFGGKISGRENLRESMSDLDKHEEFLKFEPTEYIAQGDRVVILKILQPARKRPTNNTRRISRISSRSGTAKS